MGFTLQGFALRKKQRGVTAVPCPLVVDRRRFHDDGPAFRALLLSRKPDILDGRFRPAEARCLPGFGLSRVLSFPEAGPLSRPLPSRACGRRFDDLPFGEVWAPATAPQGVVNRERDTVSRPRRPS
jgi:hypothetical protein